jgi:AraC family transcriptional regulator, regulatory protein of adaptative response / methylated-DNA-[protein]-cysteine methyltransferase
MEKFLTDNDKWQALGQHNRQANGAFFYGVLTTGVYCRPTCSSRLPKRENVRFFMTSDEAERAGFRPCKRCHPNSTDCQDPQILVILRACKMIEEAEPAPKLKEMASQVGLSSFHFHRLFKKIVGVTPKQYAMESRLNRARSHLQQDLTVTEAIYNSGFGASSRFYEKSTAALGMRPSDYRNGAHDIHIHYTVVPSYLGWVVVAATEKGICAITIGDTPQEVEEDLYRRFPRATFKDPDPSFEGITAKVLAFLEAPHSRSVELPLDIQGTAFQQRVWLALQEIPPGSTASYAEIATRIGKPTAARAVARACAANPVAVAIPCHRVVRSDGKYGGYRWGIVRKRNLLERETRMSREAADQPEAPADAAEHPPVGSSNKA